MTHMAEPLGNKLHQQKSSLSPGFGSVGGGASTQAGSVLPAVQQVQFGEHVPFGSVDMHMLLSNTR